ncbi:uncharacterized protein LOC117173014 [Belonocnema kinseyi]|uniref:uncharacterized protein LOC117173014 n=1 Tax=Belonocnema kinseyi TaxID=2817044 RepID=UPI00143D9097|nr:uncharacterized protein LOC117173014 [Belonocnema kinseyi]
MRIIIGILLLAVANFVNCVEKSPPPSPQPSPPPSPPSSPPPEFYREWLPRPLIEYGVVYYKDETGRYREINEIHRYVAGTALFVLGIPIRDEIYAIYNSRKKQIFLQKMINYSHLLNLPTTFNHLFVRLSPPTPPRCCVPLPSITKRIHHTKK